MTLLQVAIDRVSLDRATRMVQQLSPIVDVIEIGTSLTKEFGMLALQSLAQGQQMQQEQRRQQEQQEQTVAGKSAGLRAKLLADIKTCDEGKYEFDLGFASGFDILTAMGSSSLETLQTCAASARAHYGQMLIDLLECDDQRIDMLAADSQLQDAIFCLHTSIDKGGSTDPAGDIARFRERYPHIAHTAIAGGITVERLPELVQAGTGMVIMGSAITKAQDMVAAAQHCMNIIHEGQQ